MTTLAGRPGSALLVIDLQVGVVEAAARRAEVLEQVNGLIDRARADDVPVVWVQHSDRAMVEGSAAWELAPELRPRLEGEPLVHKRHADSFEDTDLEDRLAERGVGRLVVTGAQTDACIRGTIHGGFVRGYDVTLVADAHTTEDLTEWGAPPPEQVIAHANLYWTFQSGPGRTATVVPAAEVTWADDGR